MGRVVWFFRMRIPVAVPVTGFSHSRRLRPLPAETPPSETTARKDTPGSADAESSSRITPLPMPLRIVPPAAEERFTTNVSLPSLTVSPSTVTVTGSSTSPARNVTVPAAGLKSAGGLVEPGVALPPAALKFTVTVVELGFDSVTLKTAGVVPDWPSGTWMSPIEICGSGSSFPIVPSDCASGKVAFPGATRL